MNAAAPPHRCDPLVGGQGGPLTVSRVLRIIFAELDGKRDDSVVQVLTEVAGCATCLAEMVLMITGMAVSWMPERSDRVIAALDMQLAAALDQIAGRRMSAQISQLSPPWVELIAAIISDRPSLPKALWRDNSDVFDVTDPALADEAVELCRRCPERQGCRVWADSQPAAKLHGVVAGQVVR